MYMHYTAQLHCTLYHSVGSVNHKNIFYIKDKSIWYSLWGVLNYNDMEAFSTQNEAFSTKFDSTSKKIFIHCWGVSCGPLPQKCPNPDPFIAQTWP